jgi:hypothetical protein
MNWVNFSSFDYLKFMPSPQLFDLIRFKGAKNEKAIRNDGLSTVAPPAGLEPATL